MLERRVKLLNQLDIACFSIACNTAHILHHKLEKVSRVPFISMINETAKQVYSDNYREVGIMGTPSTIKYGLYQTALSKYGISTLTPTKKQFVILDSVIRNILSGKTSESDRRKLVSIADSLKKKGAEGIILGCTELPLIFPERYSLPVYNSTQILAKALLRKYYAQQDVFAYTGFSPYN